MDVRCLSASELLHDRCRRDLRYANTLRPKANGNDTIWQQMTFENFSKFLKNKSLYFRAYGEYTDYDEMRLRDFIEPHRNRRGKLPNIDQLKEAYDIFERKLFVSCWFNSVDLADVVFKVYAKNDTGIAIGTSVDRLTRQLSQAADDYNNDSKHQDNRIADIACANIQYVPQNLMGRKELFEPAQVYAPIFTKGSQFHMDHEFRVCLEMEKAETLSYNSEQNQRVRNTALEQAVERLDKAGGEAAGVFKDAAEKLREKDKILGSIFEPACRRLPVEPEILVQYIAIKNDGLFHKLGADKTIDFFSRAFNVSMTWKSNANGFMVFDIEHI